MRLNLRLSGSAENLLTSLASMLGVKPRDAVLDSMGIYHRAAQEVSKGKKLGFLDTDGNFTEITTASLSALSESNVPIAASATLEDEIPA